MVNDDEVTPLRGCPVFRPEGMAEVVATLRSKDIRHSDVLLAGAHQENDNGQGEMCLREFIGNVVAFSHGESHRTRRRLLNQLTRPEALDRLRDEVVMPQAQALLPRFIAGPDAHGNYGFDLSQFCDRLFLHLAAKFIGLVGADTDEQLDRLRECVDPLSSSVTANFYTNRAEILQAALEAKGRYLKEFYDPSRAAAEAEWSRMQAENLAHDGPMNFMQLVVSGAHPEYLDEDMAIRESVLLFIASVQTSTQTIVNTVADLDAWLADNPEHNDRRMDYGFLLDAIQESLRLRSPFSTHVIRMAATDTTIGGRDVQKGQEIWASIPQANRDPEVWGSDAAVYDPLRTVPEDRRRYGIAFGVGEHLCLGLRVVVGSDGTGGAHVRVLQTLLSAGIRPDENNPPRSLTRRDDINADFPELDIPRWISFPVVVSSPDPATWEQTA